MKPFIALRYYPKSNVNRVSLRLDKGYKYLKDYVYIYDYEAYYIKGVKRFIVFVSYLDNKRGKYTLNFEVGKRFKYKYGIDLYTGNTNFYKTNNKVYSESLKFNVFNAYKFIVDLNTNEIYIDSYYQRKLINNTNLDLRYKFMALAGLDNILGTSYIPKEVFDRGEVLMYILSNYADVDISDILFYAYFMSYEDFKIKGKYDSLRSDINYLKYSKDYFIIIYPLEYGYRIDFLLQFKGKRATYINGDKALFNKIVNDKNYIEFKMAYPNYALEDYVLIPEDLAHNVFILYDIKHNNFVRFMVY